MLDPLDGTIVGGRYRVRHLLAVGGSASIYEAEDLTFGRSVALKILHENVGPNSLSAKRLVREARASGAVSHPNVCEISEIGTLPNGCPFVVMERLVGETLRERITHEARLPFGDIVDVMMQVLSGLSAAHERRIIHRDVKPDNIFLSRRAGCAALVKLLDFGLVTTDQLMKEDLTAAGTIVGTPFYIAPEQIKGVRDLDPRVDLYACGVVLYEMTTGRLPYTGETIADVFTEILRGCPPPVAELRRDTPTQLTGVIERAMAASPRDRFGTTAAFQEALANARVEPPTTASLAALRAASAHRGPPDATRSNVQSPPLEQTRIESASKVDVSEAIDLSDEICDDEGPSESEWNLETETVIKKPVPGEWDLPTLKNPPGWRGKK